MKKFFKNELVKRKAKKRQQTWHKPELDGREVTVAGGGSVGTSKYAVGPGPPVKPFWGGGNTVDNSHGHGHGQQNSTYIPPTQEVTTHEGFGSWLSTFQPAPASSDEEKRNVERLEKLALAESQGVGVYVPPTPGPLPDAGGNHIVVFEGLLRNEGIARAQFSLPPDAPVTAIIKYLHDQGFADVLGLAPHDSPDLAVGPSIYLSNPRLITVTSGPSCHSFEKGYLINEHESFASFFNASIVQPKPIEVTQANDVLEVDGGRLNISFQRALRVPETGKTYDLPPDLGRFPLFNVANYSSRMPGNMAQKGGICMPLFQREALYIEFKYSPSWEEVPQYAIKVFVGGVNAISGKPWDRKSDKQDYLVVPPQPFLHGIATSPGVVKQFVAMPLGSGYSIEKQVTGKEDVGGIQMEIVPAYDNKGAKIASTLAFSGKPAPYSADPTIDPRRSPQESGYERGAKLYIKDCRNPYLDGRPRSSKGGSVLAYDLPSAMAQDKQNQYITGGYNIQKERAAILRDLLDLGSQQTVPPSSPFRVKAVHMLTVVVQHDGSLEYPIANNFPIQCSPFAHPDQLEEAINRLSRKKTALRNVEFVMRYNGMVLYQKNRTLWEHGMRNTVTVQYLCPSAASHQQPAEMPGQSPAYSPASPAYSPAIPNHGPTSLAYSPAIPVANYNPASPWAYSPQQPYQPYQPQHSSQTYGPQVGGKWQSYQPLSYLRVPQQSAPQILKVPPCMSSPSNQQQCQPAQSPQIPTCPASQPQIQAPPAMTYPGSQQQCQAPSEMPLQPRMDTDYSYQCPPSQKYGSPLPLPLSMAPPPPQSPPQTTPAPNWDMGIAGGGQISQKIHPDTRSRREWNLALARTLNIQILNSVAFEACTGMLTPQTPIDANSYIKAGLPFFRIYEESEATVGGGFDVTIESVGQIDASKGVKMGVSVDPNKPTVCLRCRVNLCDCILRNCNHTFCSPCVRDKMTNGVAVICAFCNKRADMVLGISAPMAAPGMEVPVATNVVVLQPPKAAELW